MNGLSGRSSLQWVDVTRGNTHVMELEVCSVVVCLAMSSLQ